MHQSQNKDVLRASNQFTAVNCLLTISLIVLNMIFYYISCIVNKIVCGW